MDIKVTGNKLTLTCELGKGVLSSTGKSLVVATTNGFVPIDGTEFKLSLNVIKTK